MVWLIVHSPTLSSAISWQPKRTSTFRITVSVSSNVWVAASTSTRSLREQSWWFLLTVFRIRKFGAVMSPAPSIQRILIRTSTRALPSSSRSSRRTRTARNEKEHLSGRDRWPDDGHGRGPNKPEICPGTERKCTGPDAVRVEVAHRNSKRRRDQERPTRSHAIRQKWGTSAGGNCD